MVHVRVGILLVRKITWEPYATPLGHDRDLGAIQSGSLDAPVTGITPEHVVQTAEKIEGCR